MEDFCQLDSRLPEDKYRGSYERCGKIISKYSVNSALDLTELFLRIVFAKSNALRACLVVSALTTALCRYQLFASYAILKPYERA